MFRNKRLYLLILFILFFSNPLFANQPLNKGQVFGLKETIYPAWFKNSFLDLAEDISEASENKKRVMLIFYQDFCPYCNALVNKNLSQSSIEHYLKTHFVVIAMHMWGDREVTAMDGKTYTEKSFARKLDVQFTPTIVFFDEERKEILRLNGYLHPKQFKQALEYVAQHQERFLPYHRYIAQYRTTANKPPLNKEPFFNSQKNLSTLILKNKPLAIFFEQTDCPDCDALHENILSRPKTRNIVEKFNNVQLNMWSNQKIITPQGKQTTASTWAKQLGIRYAPTILLFDENGVEIVRMEAVFKNFHVQSTFDYVRTGAFQNEPIIENYYRNRARKILHTGMDLYIWDDVSGKIQK